MLRALRRFRQRLLFNENFGKYLAYALGEIVLVVIGILIALQINIWNEYSFKRKQEQQTLGRFNSDLESDINQLVNLITIAEKHLTDLDTIIQILNIHKDVSKFLQLQRSILDIKTFEPNLGTYDESISLGKLQTVLNDDLRKGIFEYYREISKYNADDAMNKLRDEIFLPYINNNIYNTAESIGFIFDTKTRLPKLNLTDLASDKRYYGILISAKGKYVQVVNWKSHLKNAKTLKKKIELELSQIAY